MVLPMELQQAKEKIESIQRSYGLELSYIIEVFMAVNGDINKVTDILLGIPTTESWNDFEDSALTMD